MAVGSYDANGIWQYGESDNISPFATTLNKLAGSTSSAITADRARLATLEAGNLSGLIPMRSSSITYSGTGVSTNTLGTITFNAVTSASINGIFSATYKNYRLVWNGTTNQAGGAQVLFKLRKAGVDTSTAVYDRTGWLTRTGVAGTDAYQANVSNFEIMQSSTLGGTASYDIYSPQAAAYTYFSGMYVLTTGATTSPAFTYDPLGTKNLLTCHMRTFQPSSDVMSTPAPSLPASLLKMTPETAARNSFPAPIAKSIPS